MIFFHEFSQYSNSIILVSFKIKTIILSLLYLKKIIIKGFLWQVHFLWRLFQCNSFALAAISPLGNLFQHLSYRPIVNSFLFAHNFRLLRLWRINSNNFYRYNWLSYEALSDIQIVLKGVHASKNIILRLRAVVKYLIRVPCRNDWVKI